ncbi:hypothetical protein CCACVL1_28141 [Corchorus capsularis]|uniref:Uncharacterized protein n=1 Tax=Corchorus capsularis TaxID=210143 RepID=A0A1R3G7L1_COCAP|nr:hypothetical protein CCACVL1_28141 [Corchorus capsularis]
MEQIFCHSRRVFPIALLLVVFIWFPCLITNSYYNHEIYIEDGGVGDDEIDGAIYMEELLETLSNGSTEQLPEVLSSAADAVDLEMGRGLITTNHKQEKKKNFEVFHEEEKIAMITNKNEETAQENNVEGEMKNIVFHDENGIPPDSFFFTLNSNPYEMMQEAVRIYSFKSC